MTHILQIIGPQVRCLDVGRWETNVLYGQVYLEREAPYYYTGIYVNVGCYSALIILMVAMSFYLRFLNRRQARRRAALGLPEELEDMSIMTIEEAKAYKTKLTQQMQEKGLDEAKLYENAFDDMTDME